MDAQVIEVLKLVVVGLIGTIGLAVPAVGLTIIGRTALTGITKNPEASGAVLTNMVLIAGLTEAIGVYALIIAIILLMIA